MGVIGNDARYKSKCLDIGEATVSSSTCRFILCTQFQSMVTSPSLAASDVGTLSRRSSLLSLPYQSLISHLRRLEERRVVPWQLIKLPIQSHLFSRCRRLGILGRDFARSTIGSNIQAAIPVVGPIGTCAGRHSSLKATLVFPALQIVTVYKMLVVSTALA